MREDPINERPVEYEFVLNWLSKIYPRTVLDVGSGESAWSQMLAYCCFEVTDLDSRKGFRAARIKSEREKRYKLKQSVESDILRYETEAKYDFVSCISTLEHIRIYNKAVGKMFDLLNPGGHLALTIPYNFTDSFWNVYDVIEPRIVTKSGLCHQFNQQQVDKWLLGHRATLIDGKYYKVFSGQYWREGDRLQPVEVDKTRAQLACLLLKKAAE